MFTAYSARPTFISNFFSWRPPPTAYTLSGAVHRPPVALHTPLALPESSCFSPCLSPTTRFHFWPLGRVSFRVEAVDFARDEIGRDTLFREMNNDATKCACV